MAFLGIFKSDNERHIAKLEKIASKIEALADKYAALSDDELKDTTRVISMYNYLVALHYSKVVLPK